jgi:hypothetical protein
MARSLDDSIGWDGQLRMVAERLTEIFDGSDADPDELRRLALEGQLDLVAAKLGNTTSSELRFLFAEVRKKADRLAKRYPELRDE